MKVQTLVVTTNQKDHTLLENMNIQTDAIVGNQCDRNEIEEFEHKGNQVRWYSFKERGVGLNRNNVLMRSDADICIFADDDMVFRDGYEAVVVEHFNKNPEIDMLLFNLDEKSNKYYNNTKYKRINPFNYGKYGAARLAFRREKVHMAGVFFNLMFGGGTSYSSGEDSIFIYDCLKHGLKILAVPCSIAEIISKRESTWFAGYNDKFFYDKGVLYARTYGIYGRAIAFYNCYKHRGDYYKEYGWKNAYKKMMEGYRKIR